MVTNSSSDIPTGASSTVLQGQGVGTASAFSTATYPATTTINQVLYSSSANVVGGLATANNGTFITGTTGIPSVLANGTTGQLLTATTGNPPSWTTVAAGAGGGWFLIQNQNASNVATLDFTTGINSTYKYYIFLLNNIVPVGSPTTFQCLFSTNGSTWAASGYQSVYVYNYYSSTPATGGSGSGTQINLSDPSAVLNTSDMGVSGQMWFFDPSNATNNKRITFQTTYPTGSNYAQFSGAGAIVSDVAYTGVRFFFAGGNISTGNITLYGIKNA